MTAKEFEDQVFENNTVDYGICPPPTNAQVGLNVLIKHFLGEDWYVSLPISTEQVNTEAVYEILRKYPKRKPIRRKVKDFIKKIGEWIVFMTT